MTPFLDLFERWSSFSPDFMASWCFMFQEGEVKKEGAEEEKEQEKLGKLEYSLDYNFTEAQVRAQIILTTTTRPQP